jgi:hypothetical protein
MKTFQEYIGESKVGLKSIQTMDGGKFTLTSFDVEALHLLRTNVVAKFGDALPQGSMTEELEKEDGSFYFTIDLPSDKKLATLVSEYLESQESVGWHLDNPNAKTELKKQVERVLRYARRMDLLKAHEWVLKCWTEDTGETISTE